MLVLSLIDNTKWVRTGTVLSPTNAGDDVSTTGTGTFGDLVVDTTVTISSGLIEDSGGTLSFGATNLETTGTLQTGNVTIGSGAVGVDYTLTFNGENANCVITWDEGNKTLKVNTGTAAGILETSRIIAINNTGTTDILMKHDGTTGLFQNNTGNFFFTNTAANRTMTFQNENLTRLVIEVGGRFNFQANDILTTGGVTAGASTFGDGGTTDYSQFEPDGTLEFNGAATVFKDINIGAGTLSGPPGLQPGIANFVDENGADTGIATKGLAVGEGLSGFLEMQHDYKEGSNITFHLHWQGIAAPAGGTDNVQFQLTYTVAQTDETLDAVTTITVETAINVQYDTKLTSFGVITGTNFKIEDQFLFTLQRIAASADEYAGEALLMTVGIHYEVDTVGSRQILVK